MKGPVQSTRAAERISRLGWALVLFGTAAGALAVLALRVSGPQRGTAVVMAVAGTCAIGVLAVQLFLAGRNVSNEQELREQLVRVYAELDRAVTHDALTGVANRATFDEFLLRALSRGRDEPAGLLIADLDSFKAMNDAHGYAVGDELLRVTAARLREVVRSDGCVARLGSDDFAVVVGDTDPGAVRALAERVVTQLSSPVEIDGAVLAPIVSVGAHVASTPESPAEAMLCGEAALFAAKTSGSRLEVFDADRHRHIIDRFHIGLDVRTAVARDELIVHYQPVVDLVSRQLVKAEALIRWNHPSRGFLQPDQFIDLTETSGAIVDVGRWVLQQACRDACEWQSLPGGSGVGVTVNLSRRQLQNPSVVDDVRDALDSAELDPRLATLEVTETALMDDTAEMVTRLDKIKALGVDIAMDDFGTGYSSLSHLRALPIDLLKIDKAFVDGIAREEEEWAVAAAIIRMASSLGKHTLAEGIEQASQLAHLRTLGCELGQGWLFARAMPFHEFTSFLASQGNGCAPSKSVESRESDDGAVGTDHAGA